MQQERKHFDHLDLLDYARAVAIISVVAFHCLCAADAEIRWSSWIRSLANVPPIGVILLPINLGSLGVAIFFVVSGFCIHLSFQRQAQNYTGFYIRRFFRIYPAYLAALLLFALLLPESRLNFSGASASESWKQLISHLLLIHNFGASTFLGINPSFWSLAVEVQLYLLYPVLIFLVARMGWNTTLITLGIVGVIIHTGKELAIFNIVSGHHFLGQSLHAPSICLYGLARSPFAYWFSWALGALIADCHLQNRPQPLAGVSVVASVGSVVVCLLFRPLSEFMFMMGCVATAAVLSRLLSRPAKLTPDWFPSKALACIGTWSYSLYLLHQPLIWAARNAVLSSCGNSARFFLLGLVALAVIPLSFLFYLGIEVPAIKAGKTLLKMLRPPELSSPSQPEAFNRRAET